MGWMQFSGMILGSVLALALVRDFLAGLGRERIWSDPALEDTRVPNRFSELGLAPVIPILKEERLDDMHAFTDEPSNDLRGRLA
ncbi:MAG: hypothetical protein ACT4OM_01295 [Actinomycetota bacterium]